MKHFALYFSLIFVVVGVPSGHGFELERGPITLFFDYEHYSTKHFWNEKGDRMEAFNHFRRDKVTLYGEYGLPCGDFLTFQTSFSRIKETLNGNTSGFGDLELGWLHLFSCNEERVLAVEVLGIVPIAKYRPALRYGRLGGEVALLYSMNIELSQWPGFYTARLGFRGYTGFPSDQVRGDFTVGVYPCPRLLLLGNAHLEYGLFTGRPRLDSSNIAFNPNYRLLKTQVVGVYQVVNHLDVALGYFRHVWGRNVGIGDGVFGGANVTF